MKKISLYITIFSLAFASCKREETLLPLTDIALGFTTATLTVGDDFTFLQTVQPNDASKQRLTWTSSNPAVATVNNGVVRAISAGDVVIIATCPQDDNVSDTCYLLTFTRTEIPPRVISNCNTHPPGWGQSLGKVSFESPQTWKIGSLEWTDAVTATGCNKTTFHGGTANSINADCRSNPGQRGDLFSWCAVARFGEMLCPAPWRVPTRQDFIDLDIALGGTGRNALHAARRTDYLNVWGGVYSGYSGTRGTLLYQDTWAFYWSLSENSTDESFNLLYGTTATINPKSWTLNRNGLALRCVR